MKEPSPLEMTSQVYTEIRKQYLINCIEETGEVALYKEGVFIRGFRGRKLVENLIYERLLSITTPLIPTKYQISTAMTGFENDWLASRDDFDTDENRITTLNRSIQVNQDYILNFDYFEFDENPYKTFIKLPVIYDKAAVCPEIDTFLEQVFGEDVLPLIYQMIGYIIFPSTKYQKSFILHGVADSGKTTFISMLRCFVGYNNCTEISLQDIGKRFKRANMRDKLVNIYDDLSFHSKIKDLSVFKTLVTNPTMTGEIKNIQALGNWRNFCTQLFTCNQLPPIPLNTGDDLWRRIILIQCSNKVQKRDRNIIDKITTDAEFSGLLNKVLEAYKDLLGNGGFDEEWENADYIEGVWNINATPLKLFIEERCVMEGSISTFEFQVESNKFRDELNTYALTSNKITRELTKLGIKRKHTRRGDIYEGISIKKEETVNILDVWENL